MVEQAGLQARIGSIPNFSLRISNWFRLYSSCLYPIQNPRPKCLTSIDLLLLPQHSNGVFYIFEVW